MLACFQWYVQEDEVPTEVERIDLEGLKRWFNCDSHFPADDNGQ